MTEAEFNLLAEAGYNRIPLVLETFADLDTPLSIYLKLANQPYSYLLESVVGGERFGRYSFIGLAATTRIEVRGQDCAELHGNQAINRTTMADPLEFIDAYLDRFKVAEDARLPRFCGGLVGYFGYDTVRYIEKRLAGTHKPDPLGTPDILLLVSEEIAIVDNLSGKLSLVVYAEPGKPDAYLKARRRLSELLKKLREPAAIPADTRVASEPAVPVSAKRGITPQSSAPSNTFSMATSCRWCLRSAFPSAIRRHRWRCTARCARSTRRHICIISTSPIFTWSAPHPRSWCGSRATP
jgi:anthranilate synthase component 1